MCSIILKQILFDIYVIWILCTCVAAVVGDGFLARDITFQNTAGPSKHQAVALRVGLDLSAFYRCDMLAYQDTLYVHALRQFYINCYIAGTVDFIFGNVAAVFQNCNIHARRPNPGQRNMSDISDVVHPAGWFEWDGDFALDTLFYRKLEAQPFTVGSFIAGSSWLGSTGFPFSLGL
ncbi:hypothetical protein EZV62_013111 [Acer yangbiense]|uniref:Pectinesterase n=1 Tax=Acer yangbiense TaxID=1000413 RepID=A0A5C7HY21_9ROSI|nr:hypothetical protein EZV62_013111 [Acer yangbiense]